MKELTKERIQQIWDCELISAWDEGGGRKMWYVVHKFMCKVKGEHKIGDVSFEDAEDYLVSLNLQRCLDIDHALGHHVFRAYRTDVIGFIHARSESLSLALMDGESKPIILMGINEYKWTSGKFRRKQNRDKKSDEAVITIKAKELTGGFAKQK